MKKLLLLIFILPVFAWFSTKASDLKTCHPRDFSGNDTIELFNDHGVKINDSTILVAGTDPYVDALVGYIWVKNNTTTNMNNVFVHRFVNQEVANTTNSFCFGVNCYPPWVNESTVATEIAAGVTDKSFYADYYPDGHGGLTSITYEFFDAVTFGTRVSARATIHFHISATGISDDKPVLSGPYPNPASATASFEYNLPSSHHDATLLIRNTLGVEMANIQLENNNHKLSVDVSAFPSGMYFYSIIVDGKVSDTRKMVVKH